MCALLGRVKVTMSRMGIPCLQCPLNDERFDFNDLSAGFSLRSCRTPSMLGGGNPVGVVYSLCTVPVCSDRWYEDYLEYKDVSRVVDQVVPGLQPNYNPCNSTQSFMDCISCMFV